MWKISKFARHAGSVRFWVCTLILMRWCYEPNGEKKFFHFLDIFVFINSTMQKQWNELISLVQKVCHRLDNTVYQTSSGYFFNFIGLETRSADKLWYQTRTNRHLLLFFAQVPSLNTNWFGTKTIDFPTKSHSFQANFGTKTLKSCSHESKICDFRCFGRKICLDTGNFGTKPVWIKGGNSGKQQ